MFRSLAALLLVSASALGAQDNRTVVRVFDASAKPVPYALVTLKDGVSRVADDSGRVVFNEPPQDSIRLQVRRIGYDPFYDWVDRSAGDGEYPILIRELPRSIQAVSVRARADTPLGRSGFYDRVQRVQAGAYSARMITPEELEQRNPIRLSQVMRGESAVSVRRVGMDGAMLTGRGGNCGMSILLDGMRVTGTYEETLDNRINPPPLSSLMSVDNLIPVNGVAAIEIYASVNSIPAELLRSAGNVQCGLVAVWTGRRR
jgi:hypothetical protein